MFKIGDVVKHKHSYSVFRTTYKVVYVFSCNQDEWSVLQSFNSGYSITVPCKDYELMATQIPIRPLNEHKNTPNNVCICESRTLFLKGCQCGAVVKKKWGL